MILRGKYTNTAINHFYKQAKNVVKIRAINQIGLRYSSVYVNHRDTKDNNDKAPFDFTPENYKVVEGILVHGLI